MAEDPQYSELNSKALMALIGLSPNWRQDLAALLDSDEPIGLAVRHELASIVRGESTVTLKLEGHETSARRMAGLAARQRWYSVGEKVSQRIPLHRNVQEAFIAASLELGEDDTSCRKCYYYFRHCIDWVKKAAKPGSYYSKMSQAGLVTLWHIASIDQDKKRPTPLSAEEYDARRNSRIAMLKPILAGWDKADFAAQVLATYWELDCP
jgi:hypothetical protein